MRGTLTAKGEGNPQPRLEKWWDRDMKGAHPTSRVCKKCGETRPLVDFPFSHKPRGWRRHECRTCNYARVETHHRENREHRLAAMRKRYHEDPKKYWTPERRAAANLRGRELNKRLRIEVAAAYGGKCRCCGEREPLFLTLDHVNNDGHKMRKEVHGKSSIGIYKWAIRKEFPPCFQLLCMNCNFGKARNGGKCPHHSKQGSTTSRKA